MKKIMLAAILSITSLSTYAQQIDITQNGQGDNELKVNVTNLIGFQWFDFGYERLINEESSVGVGILFSSADNDSALDEYRTFSLTPYYRHFFGKKYAQGFFVEGFGMIHSGKEEIFHHTLDANQTITEEKYTDFALGVSVGMKIVSRRGFVAEIYGGIGRDVFGNSNIEVVSRGGISLGYRF